MRRLVRFATAYTQHRRLVNRLVRREVTARYRGSMLGLLWAVLVPLFMLAVFTFVFSVVFQIRWDAEVEGQGVFALLLFCGLIVFQFFADCISRAPSLMLENTAYIKKVVFPLEAMTWVVIGNALFNMTMNVVMLLLGHLVLIGPPPWTVVLLPLVLLPYVAGVAGAVWVLSSVGVFLRDIQQAVGVLVTVTMFLSPIFYPIEAIPEDFRVFIYMNPLAWVIEQVRAVVIQGQLPDFAGLGWYLLAGWAAATGGLWFFLRTKKAFADVL